MKSKEIKSHMLLLQGFWEGGPLRNQVMPYKKLQDNVLLVSEEENAAIYSRISEDLAIEKAYFTHADETEEGWKISVTKRFDIHPSKETAQHLAEKLDQAGFHEDKAENQPLARG